MRRCARVSLPQGGRQKRQAQCKRATARAAIRYKICTRTLHARAPCRAMPCRHAHANQPASAPARQQHATKSSRHNDDARHGGARRSSMVRRARQRHVTACRGIKGALRVQPCDAQPKRGVQCAIRHAATAARSRQKQRSSQDNTPWKVRIAALHSAAGLACAYSQQPAAQHG